MARDNVWRNKTLIGAILHLLEGFGSPNGVPEDVYLGTKLLIREVLGQSAADEFCVSINATDGAYYWRTEGCRSNFVFKWDLKQ